MASKASHDIWIIEYSNSHFAVFLETGTIERPGGIEDPGSGYLYQLSPTSTGKILRLFLPMSIAARFKQCIFAFRKREPALEPGSDSPKKFCGRVPVRNTDRVTSVCKNAEVGGSRENWCDRVIDGLKAEGVLIMVNGL